MANGVIYKLTSPTNKVYIGQTMDLAKRIRYYKTLQCKNQHTLYRSIKKYGFDSHKLEIVEEVDVEILMDRERFWIEKLQTNCAKYPKSNGLNLCDGGRGTRGRVASEESKMKNSIRNKGKVMSEESKRKISLAGIGRKHSEESKIKMSIANKGKLISSETRKKISDTLKGRNEHSFKRPIEQINLTTGIVIESFDSIRNAAHRLGNLAYEANISSVCKGKFRQAYGYGWRYK
jgi:group I intron endonuclease